MTPTSILAGLLVVAFAALGSRLGRQELETDVGQAFTKDEDNDDRQDDDRQTGGKPQAAEGGTLDLLAPHAFLCCPTGARRVGNARPVVCRRQNTTRPVSTLAMILSTLISMNSTTPVAKSASRCAPLA